MISVSQVWVFLHQQATTSQAEPDLHHIFLYVRSHPCLDTVGDALPCRRARPYHFIRVSITFSLAKYSCQEILTYCLWLESVSVTEGIFHLRTGARTALSLGGTSTDFSIWALHRSLSEINCVDSCPF